MVFDHMKHKERTVLLQPDQDVSELCFLEAERVESLGVRNEAPGYVTTVREIVAPDATTDEQLEAIPVPGGPTVRAAGIGIFATDLLKPWRRKRKRGRNLRKKRRRRRNRKRGKNRR